MHQRETHLTPLSLCVIVLKSQKLAPRFVMRPLQRKPLIWLADLTSIAPPSACKALGTIFCSGPLPLPSGRAGGLGKEEETKEEEQGEEAEEDIYADLGDLDGNDLMQFAYQIATGMVSRNLALS